MLRSAQVRADLPRKSWPCQVFGLMLGFVQLRAGFAENTVLRAGSWAKCLGPRRRLRKPCCVKFASRCSGPRKTVLFPKPTTRTTLWREADLEKHGCSHDRFAKRMFMQQMASDIFVRILRGMGACRKKPAQPASGTLSWMTPSETLLRLCLGGFGDMKWAWGGGWRLPAFLCQTTSSPGFCPISRAHFRDRKTLRKRVHRKGPPL